ncbi:MAG: DUF2007 domain-containing protein [Tissierellales bacterium]|nr:DUF2007 domain-containing protein [Tissierellales bacterium]
MNNKDGSIKLKLLIKTSDNTLISIIEALFRDNDIPYILKEKGSGGYLRIISGHSIYGTEVYVSEEDFNKATDLLDLISSEDIKD